MKVVLLENILHKGQRYKAGASLELDADTAGNFERAGVAIIEAPPKPVAVAPELPHVEQKAVRAGDKPSRSKKGARGQK